MARINFRTVYEERIKRIDELISRAVRVKEWAKVTKLRAEKAELVKRIQ